jgi:hypothetical protein
VTDTVTAKLAEWEALVEGATEGPWERRDVDEVHAPKMEDRDEATDVATIFDPDADAEFIAAARTIVPTLLGFVREVREGHEPMDWCPNPRHDAEGVCPECVVTCVKDGLDWPCHTEKVAQKWIGGEV